MGLRHSLRLPSRCKPQRILLLPDSEENTEKIPFFSFFVAMEEKLWYNGVAMERRICYYVNRKSPFTWLAAICLFASAAARIVILGMKGAGDARTLWALTLLPIAATVLYALMVLLAGKELFYKTAIPVWMMAVYFGFAASAAGVPRMVTGLCWVALVFFALVYTGISAGRIMRFWLIPLYATLLSVLAYWNRHSLMDPTWESMLRALPNTLLLAGWFMLIFAIRFYPAGQYHPTWGDRTDGRRLRTLAPMDQVSPYIMVTRNDASNLFSESLDISAAERYIRQKRREGMTNFGLTHVILAGYVRTLCRYPGLNRFLAGQKVYSRGDDVQFCMTTKKEMTSDSPETVIKVHLSRQDTAQDVYRKVNEAMAEAKGAALDSSFDHTAHALTMIPGVFLKFTVWLLRTLDYFGLLPGFLLEVSPFHGSVFLTSMGSLGIPPIYHHLYNFGNLPVFCSFGCKRRAIEVREDGTILTKKYMDVKFTLDERIVDGFYYAAFFKHFRRIFYNPELLDNPPEEVRSDID